MKKFEVNTSLPGVLSFGSSFKALAISSNCKSKSSCSETFNLGKVSSDKKFGMKNLYYFAYLSKGFNKTTFVLTECFQGLRFPHLIDLATFLYILHYKFFFKAHEIFSILFPKLCTLYF